MSAPGVASGNGLSDKRKFLDVGIDVQDGHDPLTVLPSHLLDELDTSDQITGAAGSQEQPVMLDEIPRHCDCFGVRYPGSNHNETYVRNFLFRCSPEGVVDNR